MQAICNLHLQFCKVPAQPPQYKAGRVVKLTCQYDPDFQEVMISHVTLETIHLNKSIDCKERITIFTLVYLFQYVVLSNVKNMIFYSLNVVYIISCMYHMSCISFMKGITKVNKENHSNALSLLVYIPDTRVLIYYQYLYGAIDVDGPWWHGHK